MADHDRIVPWFPDVDLDAAAAARSSRPAARPLGSRRRPATGQDHAGAAGRTDPTGLADAAGTRVDGDVYADLDYSLAGQGLRDVAAPDDEVPPASPTGYDGPPAARPGALLPALPAAALPAAAGPATPPRGAPAGEVPTGGWPGEPPAAPQLLDPRVAARRFADLLGDEDRARGERAALLLAGQQESRALAESYRDSAAEIRGQVRRVWRQVSEALAPFGVDDLEQVRGHEPAVGALPGIGIEDEPKGRRALAERDRRAAVPATRPAGSTVPTGPRLVKAAPVDAGEPVTAAADDGPLDVAAEVEQARRLWMRALATAAELRGVQRASSSLSVGLVTAGACVLVAVLAGAARLFLDTQGLPCLVAGLIAGAALVSVATDGGAKAAVRSALLSAGVAGAVVLATARTAPTDAAAVALSLASLLGAVRFGLGFGASKPETPAPGAAAKRRR